MTNVGGGVCRRYDDDGSGLVWRAQVGCGLPMCVGGRRMMKVGKARL